jgi:hypothetical protein
MFRKLILGLVVTALFSSCNQSSSNLSSTNMATPSGSTAGVTILIATTTALPNTRVVPPGSAAGTCPPPSFDLTGQTLTGGTSTLFIGDPGPTAELVAGERRANLTVPDGTTYAGTVNPLRMTLSIPSTCRPTGVTNPITANFGLTYMSVVENSPADPSVCVFRSRVDFTSFTLTVTGTPMDSALQAVVDEEVRNQILKRLDFLVADGLNRSFRGAPLPIGNDGRCDWLRLNPGGGINR